jgi:hypothetical protein
MAAGRLPGAEVKLTGNEIWEPVGAPPEDKVNDD